MNKVRGLELGADDYVTKPFSPMELIARVKAVMRRASVTAREASLPPFEKGAYKLDYAAHRVSYQGKHIALTPTEFNVMFQLTRNYPNVVTNKTLLAKVWGEEYMKHSDYVKVHVQRIRSKFGAVVSGADPIVNERGIGYRLEV